MAAVAIQPARFPWFDTSRYAFSLGLKTEVGNYLAGHTASRFDRARGRIVVDGDMAAQANTAYDKVAAILEGDGKSLADVTRIVEYLTPAGIEQYAAAEAVRRERLGDRRPVVNTAPVQALLRRDALIEIEATAGGGDTVFLPTVLPLDADGDIVGPGDLVAQTHAVFDTAERLLAGHGLGLDALVKTIDYVSPAAMADYKRTAAVRRARLGPVFPAAAGFFMPRLLHPEALIQLDMIASREPLSAVDPGWARGARLTYSAGVKAGRLLHIAGFGSADPNDGQMRGAGDVVAQAEAAYDSVFQVLAAAGGGPEHLVNTIEYTTPEAQDRYREVGSLRQRLLRPPYPAATGPLCQAMVRPDMLFEVEALAILDDGG